MLTEVAEQLALIRQEIRVNALEVGRNPETITLVAASKNQPIGRLEEAIAAGQRVFGENRVSETKDKWPLLRQRHPDLRLHLLGPLQTNKAKEAVRLFDVIESLDRPSLATKLAQEMDKSCRRPVLFVEVNTGEEPQKSGVIPGRLKDFLELCRGEHGLTIEGLMCIPPVNEEVSLHFALLAELGERYGCGGLSMGMSEDYALAVRFGATQVRVGRRLFGQRCG